MLLPGQKSTREKLEHLLSLSQKIFQWNVLVASFFTETASNRKGFLKIMKIFIQGETFADSVLKNSWNWDLTHCTGKVKVLPKRGNIVFSMEFQIQGLPEKLKHMIRVSDMYFMQGLCCIHSAIPDTTQRCMFLIYPEAQLYHPLLSPYKLSFFIVNQMLCIQPHFRSVLCKYTLLQAIV